MAPPLTSAYGRSRWTPAERCAAEDAGGDHDDACPGQGTEPEVWNRTGSVAAARATSAACVALDDLETFFALESSLRAREEPPREPPAVAESARYLAEFTRVWDRGELGYRTIVFQGRIAGFGGVQPKLWRGAPLLESPLPRRLRPCIRRGRSSWKPARGTPQRSRLPSEPD